jgi:putative FmdB family regulatory protein
MPRDEYFCHACKRWFSKPPTPSDYKEGDVVCPHCGSDDVEQRTSTVHPTSARKPA